MQMNWGRVHPSTSRKAFRFTHFCTGIFEYLNTHIFNPLVPVLFPSLTYLLLDSRRCYSALDFIPNRLTNMSICSFAELNFVSRY